MVRSKTAQILDLEDELGCAVRFTGSPNKKDEKYVNLMSALLTSKGIPPGFRSQHVRSSAEMSHFGTRAI